MENKKSNLEHGVYELSFNYKGAPTEIKEFFMNILSSSDEGITLPLKIWPESDFFADKDRLEQYTSSLRSFDYSSIESLIKNYVDEKKPEESDSAYQILSMLNENLYLLDNCAVIHDDFENIYTIYHKEVTEISNSTNVVPYLESSKYFTWSNFHINVGFIKSEWLFFDTASIKLQSGELVEIPVFETQRDVLSGSSIREYYSCSTFNDIDGWKALSETQSATIRFKNSDNDSYYDHILTNTELSALNTIYEMYMFGRELSKPLSEWNSEW